MNKGERRSFTRMSELFKFVKQLDERGIAYSSQVLADCVTVEIL